MSFELLDRHDLVEEILEPHRVAVGAAYDGYRGHVYRMLNYVRYLVPDEPHRDERTAVGAAFHDLPVTFDWDLDYLVRAADLAEDYLASIGHPEWTDEVRLMIDNHHKLTRYRGSSLVEAARRADFIDIGFGLRRFGIPRALVKEISATFPTKGFYPIPVLGNVIRHAVTHPLRPMPWLRW